MRWIKTHSFGFRSEITGSAIAKLAPRTEIKTTHIKTSRRRGLSSALILVAALWLWPWVAHGAEQVSVQKLESRVGEAAKKSDRDATRTISQLELTQRLSRARFAKLKAELPGKNSIEALVAVADASAFLETPPEDRLDLAAPDHDGQGQILSRGADFVACTVAKMPDFIATKSTTRYEDVKLTYLNEEPVIVAREGFRLVDRSEVTAIYRDGKEVDEAPKANRPDTKFEKGLYSWGIFGPLLGVVMTNVLNGKVGWSHWEQSSEGPAAVFRFVVPPDRSAYNVTFCCVNDKTGLTEYKATPAYHGEISINPNTGAILRMVLKTDLKTGLDLSKADLAVEYGSVEIGGRNFICPVKSISIATVVELVKKRLTAADGSTYHKLVPGPQVTAINDVVFDNYHQFRSEIRILPYDASQEPQQ